MITTSAPRSAAATAGRAGGGQDLHFAGDEGLDASRPARDEKQLGVDSVARKNSRFLSQPKRQPIRRNRRIAKAHAIRSVGLQAKHEDKKYFCRRSKNYRHGSHVSITSPQIQTRFASGSPTCASLLKTDPTFDLVSPAAITVSARRA